MAWTIRLSKEAEKALERLDKSAHTRIIDFLSTLSSAPSPREKGAALAGQFSGYWRYRVGDYRLICELRDGELVVLVLKVGHRRGRPKRGRPFCLAELLPQTFLTLWRPGGQPLGSTEVQKQEDKFLHCRGPLSRSRRTLHSCWMPGLSFALRSARPTPSSPSGGRWTTSATEMSWRRRGQPSIWSLTTPQDWRCE